MQRNLYLFDFDGTLTKVDTLFDFLKFTFPTTYRQHYLKFIPQFALVKLKVLDAAKVKESFVSSFLKGYSRDQIRVFADAYFKQKSTVILRSKAVEYIQSINNYHDKYIVSASTNLWLEPFAAYLGCGLICTEAKFTDQGIFTGEFSTPNCNHDEKAIRIQKEIDLSLYDQIFAFGDTKGDKAMFDLATTAYYRYFD